MSLANQRFAMVLAVLICCPAAYGQWLTFTNETSTRYSGSSSLFTTDNQEKDYDYGDIDNDGDDDLVIVRKQPFTTSGRYPNALLMNENGVLTERSADYASASDVPGDQGFLTATNDRDVRLADVNNDGWLDIVTATTLSDGQPKHISHPRIYINRGAVGGVWQGFRYEDARIPQLEGFAPSGFPHAPRFCSIDVGDVNGDGFVDLYFGDYDSGPTQTLDFNDRLLINDGNGYFTDETSSRFFGTIAVATGPTPFQLSAFGTAVALRDMNGDGTLDIVKDTALNPPQYVGIAYNALQTSGATGTLGIFESHLAVDQSEPYFIEAGDLNNDGMLDLLEMDDGNDHYYLNQGNDGFGRATFQQHTFVQFGQDPGFPGNTRMADLDNDGFLDVYSTNADVDIATCGNRSLLYRNLGDTPNVTLESVGNAPWIPTSNAGHDVALMDVNGDGWLDIVLGLCNGSQIWINQPPEGLAITYPDGLPPMNLPCNQDYTFHVQLAGIGGAEPVSDSLTFYLSTDGSPFLPEPVTNLGDDLYELTIPAAPVATSQRWYLQAFADGSSGSLSATDPEDAPTEPHSHVVADELVADVEDFESGMNGWTVETSGGLTSGAWELVTPVASPIAPGVDASPVGTMCFVTENGPFGGAAGAADVDGGYNRLVSPLFDLDGTNALISFSAWFVTQTGVPDQLEVEISNNDGASWVAALTITDSAASWTEHSFLVSDVVTPTAQMRVRFICDDDPNDSVTEGAIDDFTINTFECAGTSFERGDVNADGAFDIGDPVALLGYVFSGGATPTCLKAADCNDDSAVNIADAVFALDVLFAGGGSLPAPFGSCGLDATDDTLTCDSFAPCN